MLGDFASLQRDATGVNVLTAVPGWDCRTFGVTIAFRDIDATSVSYDGAYLTGMGEKRAHAGLSINKF